MTMTMTVETPPPDRIRPAAVAGLLLGDLIAPAAIYYAARALGAPVVLALILGGLACLPRQVAAVELLLAVSLPLNAAAAVPAVVPVIAVPVLLGGTALYGQRTGLGIRRSLEAMSQQATGGAR
jgi:hypothetical protein